jgi:hypothetical protein
MKLEAAAAAPLREEQRELGISGEILVAVLQLSRNGCAAGDACCCCAAHLLLAMNPLYKLAQFSCVSLASTLL